MKVINLKSGNIKLSDAEYDVFVSDPQFSGKFYIAIDSCGEMFAYLSKPTIQERTCIWDTLHYFDSAVEIDFVDAGEIYPEWRNSLTCFNNMGDFIFKCTNTSTQIKLNHANFMDELAELLIKYDASVSSKSLININVKGAVLPHNGIKGVWSKKNPESITKMVLTNLHTISAKTLRKCRLRTKVV